MSYIKCAPEDETPSIASHHQYLSSRLDRLGRIITASQTEQADPGYETAEAATNLSTGFYDVLDSNTVPPTEGSYTQFEEPTIPLSNFEDPGFLLLAPQSKARYVSPAYFAMISQEVREYVSCIRQGY